MHLTLKEYLSENIPLATAMHVGVHSAGTNQVILSAPLAPNINHRGTIFGGSASAVAILSCWGMLWVTMKTAEVEAGLVIRRNSMEFNKPMKSDILARCASPGEMAWKSFWDGFHQKGKGRITLVSEIISENEVCSVLTGDFVAIRSL